MIVILFYSRRGGYDRNPRLQLKRRGYDRNLRLQRKRRGYDRNPI